MRSLSATGEERRVVTEFDTQPSMQGTCPGMLRVRGNDETASRVLRSVAGVEVACS